MSFEVDISQFNEHFFFREFTFSKNTFRPSPAKEVELADNIVWLDDLVVVFQLKEHGVASPSTADDEARWFKRKVITLGTRQSRDTLAYLNANTHIKLQNLTYACKYDLKLQKCIGVSFAPEKDGWYSVAWCFMEFPWEFDEELDQRLKRDNPFRLVRTTEIDRYTYHEEQ